MSERRVRNVGRPTYGRPQQPSYRRRPVKRRLSLGIVPKRLIILGIILVAVLLIIKQSFAITKVVVSAPSRASDIQAEAQKALDANWHQNSLLTFDDSTLASTLLAADPMLKSVTAHRQWPHTIKLEVTLKQPSMGWSSGNQAYLLDRDGTVIGALPAGSPLPVVIDGSNLPVALGKQVVGTRFVTFVTAIAASLPGQGIKTSQLSVTDTTLDLYVATNKGYKLIFDTSRPAAGELSDLATVESTLSKQKRVPAEYIDLRIAGKAYFK